jgi:tRNA(fMet)-specific endonuclease VapC
MALTELSLDASILIHLANGRKPEVRARFESAHASGDRLFTCSLAAHEILYGAWISGRPQAELLNVRDILGQIAVAEFDHADAEAAARLRAHLRSVGQSMGSFDSLIAGQGLNRGWTVVTAKLREFERVPGLAVIDWTRPAPGG